MSQVHLRLHKPHPGQVKVLEEAKRFNVVACGRRWGKTEMCVDDLAIPVAIEGQRVGWFAPSYKLLDEAWQYTVEKLVPIHKHLDVSKQQHQIRFPGGGRIDWWTLMSSTANKTTAGRGREYDLVVVDEAAHAPYLEADWQKSIAPTLFKRRGSAWFPSTPWGQNYFFRLWCKGQDGEPDWASWQMPTSTNPHIPAEELERFKAQMTADAWAQEGEAEFLADAANPFGLTHIAACIVPWEPGVPTSWGVDLAKSSDWTVITGLDDTGRVVAWQRWQSDWRNTTRRLKAMIGDTPALVDATGVGDPIVEELQAACGCVEGYKFTRTSKQQLMEGLASAIQQRSTHFPEGVAPYPRVIRSELEAFMYEYTPTGVRYTAPEGCHDDCVDSLALAVRCRTMRPVVELDVVGYGDDDEDDVIWSGGLETLDRVWE